MSTTCWSFQKRKVQDPPPHQSYLVLVALYVAHFWGLVNSRIKYDTMKILGLFFNAGDSSVQELLWNTACTHQTCIVIPQPGKFPGDSTCIPRHVALWSMSHTYFWCTCDVLVCVKLHVSKYFLEQATCLETWLDVDCLRSRSLIFISLLGLHSKCLIDAIIADLLYTRCTHKASILGTIGTMYLKFLSDATSNISNENCNYIKQITDRASCPRYHISPGKRNQNVFQGNFRPALLKRSWENFFWHVWSFRGWNWILK